MSTSTVRPGRLQIVLAFAAIYVIWGSTYLAILIGIETIPPLLMAGARFLIAGLLMSAWCWVRKEPIPEAPQIVGAAVIGLALLGVGNGGVTWAEQTVPSGIAALVVSTIPLWMVLIDWLRPGGTKPSALVGFGVIIGFAGLAWLLGPNALAADGSAGLGGVAVLLIGSVVWAMGSVASRSARLPSSALVTTSIEMLTAGIVLTVVGLGLGEGARLDLSRMSLESLAALAYLVIFGSCIAFSAYVWLLRVSTPAKVSTYAFVNPVIAVLLGAWLVNEPVGSGVIGSMAAIVAGVAAITIGRSSPSSKSSEPQAIRHEPGRCADSLKGLAQASGDA